MKTGNTGEGQAGHAEERPASMEPGHEDREYPPISTDRRRRVQASMEPGHEDREYAAAPVLRLLSGRASMEPGHEDREYPRERPEHALYLISLNGARS